MFNVEKNNYVQKLDLDEEALCHSTNKKSIFKSIAKLYIFMKRNKKLKN